MCGIAGFIDLARPGMARSSIQPMIDSLARRGPDAEGTAAWPGVALGHRRLAILDLSDAGRQPMLSDDGSVGLVFNGCIYNFLELRAELEKLGHRFHSQCDTEVLLRGYQQWGVDQLVPRLHGMYAFGIWDEPRRKLTLVRDRLGVKPLVYRATGDRIAFASTVGALQAADMVDEIDPQAVLEFLEFGFVTDERSIYRGVSKVPPAGIVEWTEGKLSERGYWSLPPIDESSSITFDEAVEETERLLVEAVRLRLCSDVPIGALLSGGVDSALVCWALTKLNANIKAFTVGAPDDPSDESAQARETAAILGIPHEMVTLPAVDAAPLDELVDAFSEPFACQSALGMLRVSRAVKHMATVLLTGDGGDDVFLGYTFLYNVWRAQELARKLPPFAPAAWRVLRPLFQAGAPLRRARNFADYAVGGLGAYNRVRDGLPYFKGNSLLGDRLRDLRLQQREIPDSFPSARRLLSDAFAYQRKNTFTSEFMPKVDGGAMYYAIEARGPLLDQKLWEFAAALPPGIRFHGGRLKAVLREIVRRRIGPQVAFRQKRGFTIPVERWLAKQWSASFATLQSGTILEQEGWVRRRSLEPHIRAALESENVPVQLWYLLVLEQWLQRKWAGAERLESRPPVLQ